MTRATRSLSHALTALRARLRRGVLAPPVRRAAALGVIAGLLTSPLPGGEDTVGTAAGSLAKEWAACAIDEAPPQGAWHHADLTTYDEPRDWDQGTIEGLPVVVPRERMPAPPLSQLPRPDREGSVPRPVRVAVIDSGVAADHPDVGVVRPGLDLLNPCGDGRQDVTGHGTTVAGVISSSSYGAAPAVEIIPVRTALDSGRHLPSLSAAAVVWATHAGADVITMSYTSQHRGPRMLEQQALRYARSHGVALVAAAGNDPSRPAGYPAAYPETLSVTSVDASGELSLFAAREGAIDVAAPGSRVVTLWPDGSVRVASGTSLATPVVASTIAQMLWADPSLTGAGAVELLRGREREARWPAVNPTFGPLDVHEVVRAACQTVGTCPDPAQEEREAAEQAVEDQERRDRGVTVHPATGPAEPTSSSTGLGPRAHGMASPPSALR